MSHQEIGALAQADTRPAMVRSEAHVISAEVPKMLPEDAAKESDVCIAMGCGDTCLVFPGKRHLDWQLQDTAGQGVEALRPIRDEIEHRVPGLLDDLGVLAQR